MVALEDHPTLRHVTGSPPHNQVLNLIGGQRLRGKVGNECKKNEGLLERPGRGWLWG